MATIREFKENLVKGLRDDYKKEKTETDITIKIAKDDIKEGLGKKRLHKSITDKIKTEFESSGFTIKENCNSEICVIVPKEKINENVKTYKEIMKKNK